MAKNFRTFVVNNEEYIFSVDAFVKAFQHEKSKRRATEKCTTERLKEEIADKINISPESVKKWYSGANGPTDIETVKSLADFFGTDYMVFLMKKNGETNMNKMNSICVNEEKEVILSVFKVIVDIIWLESRRFRPDYFGGKYQEQDLFMNKRDELYDEAYYIVDTNSLLISYDTRLKLYNTLSELDKSLAGMEAAPGRWLRLNHLFFDAREYFLYGGFNEYEEEKIAALHKDAENGIERPYYIEINGCRYEGFHKETTMEDVEKIIGEDAKGIIPIPYDDDSFGYQYTPDEIYKFEFMKTILLIFREDFPDFWRG